MCAVAAALRSRAPGSFGRGLGREGSIRVCASARIDVVWWTSERRRAVCALLGFRGFPFQFARQSRDLREDMQSLIEDLCRLTAGPNHVWGGAMNFPLFSGLFSRSGDTRRRERRARRGPPPGTRCTRARTPCRARRREDPRGASRHDRARPRGSNSTGLLLYPARLGLFQ